MKQEKKGSKFILWIALFCCLLILSKFILFKKSPGYYKHYFAHGYHAYSVKKGWKHANTKPFSSIRLFAESKYVTSEYSYKNIGGNIVGFIPLGLLLP
ncbi:MAG: VanZ family protein, partial [Lacibacter sp.]